MRKFFSNSSINSSSDLWAVRTGEQVKRSAFSMDIADEVDHGSHWRLNRGERKESQLVFGGTVTAAVRLETSERHDGGDPVDNNLAEK